MSTARGKVLVAMSGGVDSSVAAAVLQREGYDVVGCFMRLGSPGESLDAPAPDDACDDAPGTPPAGVRVGHQGCCSILDASDARLVAARLGVSFYVCNFKRDFGRIVDYFADEYAAGRTPNPCVRCNDWLKFGKLHEYAASIGADLVASGHYARIEGGRLRRGVDRAKDQSYVLFGIPPGHLGRTLFPIGGLPKPEVRELARAWGLPVFDKPDSQEICFVPDNDYAGLVERLRPDVARPGALVNAQGETLGAHAGHHRFTIGQRRGVSVSLGHAVYVVSKDPATNTVRLGTPDDLLVAGCEASEANWLGGAPVEHEWFDCVAQYRAHGETVPARARALPDDAAPTPSGRRGRFEVVFERPVRAVAPGQAIVLYAPDDDAVIGGGWIGRTRAAQ
ncbi:MAG: tRNA 2-thiouridine(34) synthase MnmA [Planctomycetota bacterium]|nr:tRNA 2-thiouridine(34) synthase MnmA [Planctomycetota bacterium]